MLQPRHGKKLGPETIFKWVRDTGFMPRRIVCGRCRCRLTIFSRALKKMPAGIFNTILMITGEGDQVSTSGSTKFTFIGVLIPSLYDKEYWSKHFPQIINICESDRVGVSV